MRCELLTGRVLVPALSVILCTASAAAQAPTPPDAAPAPASPAGSEVAPAPDVTPVATPGDACFPKCRSGYLCHEGACITGCNPPCAADERCTPEGECVPKVAFVAPAPAVLPAEGAAPKPSEPARPPRGVAVGFMIGAAACATPEEHGCRTADGDFGITASLRAGYSIFPWLVVDGELSFLPIFHKDDPLTKVGLLFALGAGPRFYPLAHRHRADLVFGLHFGYLASYTKNEEDALSVVQSSSVHAVHLSYEAGVEFKVSSRAAVGLKLDLFEPFWVTGCYKISGSTSCDRLNEVDNDQLYFGAGFSGDFLL
jgi:hypothetical protein